MPRLVHLLPASLICLGLSGQAHADTESQLVRVFAAICVEAFPDWIPTPETLKALGATGDDPNAPARPSRNGVNRSWSIDPPNAESRNNVHVQTYFGSLNGQKASGCQIVTDGKLEQAELDRLLALLPGAKRLPYDKSTTPQLDTRRWVVRLKKHEAVFTVVESNANWPSAPYFETKLERYPPRYADRWRKPPR